MSNHHGDDETDDLNISSDTRLLRRIPAANIGAGGRINSDAFREQVKSEGTSVDIWEAGHGPDETLQDHSDFGIVFVTAGEVRAAGLGVVRNALPQNPHHALIRGDQKRSKLRKLRDAAEIHWIERPPAGD